MDPPAGISLRPDEIATDIVLLVANGSKQLVAQIGIDRRGGCGLLRFGG